MQHSSAAHGILSLPRMRSNSVNTHSGPSEIGSLARISSPSPDSTGGSQNPASNHSSSSSIGSSISFGGPFPCAKPINDLALPCRNNSLFVHPSLNSSAPALSCLSAHPLDVTHLPAMTSTKRLTFATNLNIYDTFSAATYDRRSEPATWSRLTPALAQRIKEELNSYKMEEMEVHLASRIQ